MSYNLFTYGTLMSAEKWKSITGHENPSRPFSISGFQRRKLNNRSYPGLIRKQNCRTKGLLYTELNEHNLSSLDAYEGPEYQRIQVSPNSLFPIFVYLYVGDPSLIVEEDWFPDFKI